MPGSKPVKSKFPFASREERLNQFPTANLPLSEDVRIHWNEHLMPFVEAKRDEDAALVLGMVHAFLRLGQMEILRRIASGRLAEVAGPPAIKIDHTLKILDLGRANDEIEANWPPSTRRFIIRFVEGINFFLRNTKKRPHEFKILGIKDETWTARDLLRIARLGAADINWLVLFSYLRLHSEKGFREFWRKYVRFHEHSAASFAAGDRLEELLSGFSKSGSNSFVIGAERSHSGFPLMANDPHLGIMIPNFWLLAGWKSPSYHLTGMMIPALPFAALGRNLDIAWGGTNMRSWSSELVNISDLPKEKFKLRKERIHVRFWKNKNITLRFSSAGPVISDSPLLKRYCAGKTLALKWVGHDPSDEITAFLGANRARDWREFSNAFRTYAVSGQTFLYADRYGHIGILPAVRLPKRAKSPGKKLILDLETAEKEWQEFWSPLSAPNLLDPTDGFIVSANNRPFDIDLPLGTFFSPNDRVQRLKHLIANREKLDLKDLAEIQCDTYSISSIKLRDQFLEVMSNANLRNDSDWLQALRSWEGFYSKDEKGPLAFQLLLFHFVNIAFKAKYSKAIGEAILSSPIHFAFAMDLLQNPDDVSLVDLNNAIERAANDFKRFNNWGELHRLRVFHPLQGLPLVGQKYVLLDLPGDGSNETVQKTQHGVTNHKHTTRYGAQARHITDLSDLDENYFVLLGGQDGWLASENLLDQVEHWQQGKLIRFPLTLATINDTFKDKTELKATEETPGSGEI